jgi:hypothetical protein
LLVGDVWHTPDMKMSLKTGAVLSATLLLVSCANSTTDSGGGGSAAPTPSGTPVAAYVLIGGASKPAVTDLYLDSRLDAGEIFIMAKNPLTVSRTYQVTYDVTIGGTQYTGQWSFTTGTLSVGATTQVTPLAELNRYRTEAGVPVVTSNANLTTAARRHSGYQCERGLITHTELVNNSLPFNSGTNPGDTSADMYIHYNFASRISLANGGTAGSNSWPGTGITTAYETIATNGGVSAVAGLWDTVYHRLPMMRRHTQLIGEAQRTDTGSDSLYLAATPAPYDWSTGTAYETIDYTADGRAQIQSMWPASGAVNIGTTFNTDTEGPDPVSSGNSNGTPDDTTVGTPIHIILPSTGNITALSVVLTIQ